MATDHEVAVAVEPEPPPYVGSLDPGGVSLQDLSHRTTGTDDLVRRDPLAEKVRAGDLGVGQVNVGSMVDDTAIDLLWDPAVEASVPRLHVEDGNLPTLGCDRRQTTIRVSQKEDRIGTPLREKSIHGHDHLRDCLGRSIARSL